MKGLRNCTVALLMGLCAPVLIWVGAGCAFYQDRKQKNLLKQALPDATCSLDSDCPPGFVCLGGHCVAAK